MRVGRLGKLVQAATAAAALLALVNACSSPGQAEPDAIAVGGVEIPLKVGQSNDDRRATITTTIGGAQQSLLFDTGSAGLSVFATAVPDSVASLAGEPFQERFGGGVLLGGVTVAVPMEVAGNPSNGPVMIRLVQSATCTSSSADCSAKDGLEGLAQAIGADGIFGAGLWSTDSVFSPLTQLESGIPESIAVSWSGTTGSAIIDPIFDADAVATLQMAAANPASLPNGANAWDNRSVPICWQIGRSPRSCATTILDTGAAAMSFPIGFPGGPTTNVEKLDSDQQISASVSPDAAPFLEFATGTELGENLVTVIPGQSSVNSGLQFFDDFIVVFSVADGTVVLYPRS